MHQWKSKFNLAMALKTCILVVLLLNIACSNNSTKQEKIQTPLLSLQQDSGFVTKKIGLPFLIAHQLTDTTGTYWKDYIKDSDTIAKYYKVKQTGHFYYCTIDRLPDDFETHLILELNQAGELLQSERFFHGHYHCCWKNRYEGFQKYGDYFGIKTCNTGLGFCASSLYLFKKLASQDTLEPVLIDYWEAMGGEDRNPRRLSSFLTTDKDTLLVHYKLEEGKMVDDKPHFKVQKTRKFNLTYIRKDQQWISQDSTMFKLGVLLW